MLNKGVGEISLLQIFGLIEELYNQIKNLINGKVSPSDLSKVATSGNYSDLKGKPTALPANGGDSATVCGYGIRVVTDVNDPGKEGFITIIK